MLYRCHDLCLGLVLFFSPRVSLLHHTAVLIQLFVLHPAPAHASLISVVLNPESIANIGRLSIPPPADEGGIGCSNGMIAQLDAGADCKPMAATLNMLDAPSRVREAARFVPFYRALVPIVLLCLFGSFAYVRHKKAGVEGGDNLFDCTGVFGMLTKLGLTKSTVDSIVPASLLTFKVFDLMSDWGMNTISLHSMRFTDLGKMGSGLGSGNFKRLQTASTFFCVCGTVLFLLDTAAYLKSLSTESESHSRKIRWKTLGAVVTLEDFPQIIICAIYLNAVGVDVQKDQLAIVSLVFSLISLVYNSVSVWYTYQKSQIPDAPKTLTQAKFEPKVSPMLKQKGSKKPEKSSTKKKKKKKGTVEDGKRTSVTTTNPMFAPQMDAGGGGGAGGYLEISVEEEPAAAATSKDVGSRAVSMEDSVAAAAPAPNNVPEETFDGFEDGSSSTAAVEQPIPPPKKSKKKKPKKEQKGNAEWNALHLTKEEALQKIMGGKPGSFVFRASDKAVAVLSMIKPDSKMYNRVIEKRPSGFFLAKMPSQTFPSLDSIAQHYTTPAHAEEGGLPCPLLRASITMSGPETHPSKFTISSEGTGNATNLVIDNSGC